LHFTFQASNPPSLHKIHFLERNSCFSLFLLHCFWFKKVLFHSFLTFFSRKKLCWDFLIYSLRVESWSYWKSFFLRLRMFSSFLQLRILKIKDIVYFWKQIEIKVFNKMRGGTTREKIEKKSEQWWSESLLHDIS
jgi:hypothetical protein